MSLTRSPVTSSKSRLVGAPIVHCAIRPSLRALTRNSNDISHPAKVKMYREWGAAGQTPSAAGRGKIVVDPGFAVDPVHDMTPNQPLNP
jgi:hypothetical protein